MGSGIAARLAAAGHHCTGYDPAPAAAAPVEAVGSLEALVGALGAPRVVWMMVPAGAVASVVDDVAPLLAPGDLLVDGGNSHHADSRARAAALAESGVEYADVGTSGGVFGSERGYCLMVGASPDVFSRLEPVLAALAPGVAAAPRTPGRAGEPAPAERGYLHCGPPGAGHFVKMVHNAVEYGLMAAYAEGLDVLHRAAGPRPARVVDAETAPLRDPTYDYDLDVAAIAEVWRRGSVVSSFLLDLTAAALAESPGLDGFAGRVADSGEGRWTVQAAVELGVPVPVLAASVFERFASRDEGVFAARVLSAMRARFGGHAEPGAG